MRNLGSRKTIALLASVLLCLAAREAIAQDPVKLAPEVYKVLLENEQVRILEIRVRPGGKSPMHSHPSHVVYSFTDSKTKFTLPDGKRKEMQLKAGQAAWSDAVTHAAENIGTTEVHVLNIELKKAPKKTK